MGDMDFFTKGMEVEVCSDDVGLRGAWFRATVLRSNLKKKTICVEYKTLVASEKDKRPLREFVNMVNLRPIPPREMKRNFESSDEVDAYHNDGWWEGVIIKVIDNSRYSVYFRPGKEEIEFEESQLRIHREWVNGFWVPPMKEGEEEMHQSQEQRRQEEGEKIKNNQMGDLDFFTKGMEVEVCSDDVGFRGAWFTATVLRSNLKQKKICVEYKTLIASEKDTRPLREFVNMANIRPIPPREIKQSFESSEEVDAYHNDGWWEGVVVKVLDSSRYSVYFRSGKEEIEFEESQLRIHREWVNGFWVPPMKEEEVTVGKVEKKEELPQSQQQQEEMKMKKKQKNSIALENDQTKTSSKLEVKFHEGMHVEVSSDEEGFVGAWYTATVVKVIGKNRFLVEYQTLRTEDESELLKEEVDDLHIRPSPPDFLQVDSFSRLEEVDAMHNDGWWVGVISKVLGNSRYYVYFRENNEEIEFGTSQLRLHQDWIDGKWLRPSEVLLREVKEV